MANFFSDLRFGARLLRKAPITSAAAILSLALGIGGTTTMFSAVDAVLLRPLPFASPERLVLISATSPMSRGGSQTRRGGDLAGRLSRLSQRLELRRHGFGVDQLHAADRRRHTGARAGRTGLGKFFLVAGCERARRAAVSTRRRCAWTACASSHQRSVVGASIWPRGQPDRPRDNRLGSTGRSCRHRAGGLPV